MMGIAMLGILSGIIFASLATFGRGYAGAIIVMPLIAAPIAYAFVWRDALQGQCFFAHAFGSDDCLPLRAFISTSLNHAADAAIVGLTHLVTAFVTLILLMILRSIIDALDFRMPAEIRADEARAEAEAKAEAEAAARKEAEAMVQETLFSGALPQGTMVKGSAAGAST